MVARRALLQEKGVTWRSHWGDVKPLIADDPRYAAMPRGDRDVYFRKYRDELEVSRMPGCGAAAAARQPPAVTGDRASTLLGCA